jgi:cell division protein FtsB
MGWKKVILYLIVLLGFLFVMFLPGFSELERIKEERLDVQRRSQILKQNNSLLEGELEDLKDPRYVERKAREKLGIIKKGEYVYKPTPAKTGTAAKPAAPSAKTTSTAAKK